MSIVKDITSSGVVSDITGRTAADAARESADIQARAISEAIPEVRLSEERALGFLAPFQGVGQQGIDLAGFLTDPAAQFDFLQNNPLFQLALNNANTQTQNFAASRGRLSAGDTLQKLSENVLLSASPLISGQKQSIFDLLNLGSGVATRQANIPLTTGANVADLITSRGAVGAAGTVGAANARTQGAQNLLQTGLTAAGAILSDERLKKNIKKIGEENGYNKYSWQWNDLAKELFGLNGSSFGVIAQEVKLTYPEAVQEINGYMSVDYSMLGVSHGR